MLSESDILGIGLDSNNDDEKVVMDLLSKAEPDYRKLTLNIPLGDGKYFRIRLSEIKARRWDSIANSYYSCIGKIGTHQTFDYFYFPDLE